MANETKYISTYLDSDGEESDGSDAFCSRVMAITERGERYNTGIVCRAATPEDAFKQCLEQFRKRKT